MKNDTTSIYFKFFEDEIEKLDFKNNLTINLPSAKYDTHSLGSILNFREDKIEPNKYPLEKFNLIGVLDISMRNIYVKPKEVIGAKILSQKILIESGDVVISRLNPRKNRVAIIPENKTKNKLIGSSELYSMFSKYDKEHNQYVHPKFLALFLKIGYSKKQMYKISGLTPSRSRIPIEEFKKILIPLPKLDEQLKILKRIEDKENELKLKRTELKNKKSDFLKENKKFGNVEMIKINDLNFYSTFPEELENRIDFIANNPEIKKGICFIKSHQHFLMDGILEQDFEYGINDYGKEKGKIPFINIENLNEFGKINFDGIRYLNDCPKDKLLKEGDLIISRSRNVGVCASFNGNKKATFGSYILRFRVKDNPKYVVYYVNSAFGQLQTLYYKTGSTGSNINPSQLKKIAILKEKEGVVDRFDKIIKEVEDLMTFVNIKENEFFEDFEKTLI